MEFVTIPIIVIICTIFMSILKLFTKGNEREEEMLSALVPAFGALITIVIHLIHSEYLIEIENPLIAITIGFVSGQSALETTSTIDYIKSKKELKDIIIEELQTDATQEIIKEQIDITDIVKEELQTTTTQEIIKEHIDTIQSN